MSRIIILLISLIWASLVFVSWEGTVDSCEHPPNEPAPQHRAS